MFRRKTKINTETEVRKIESLTQLVAYQINDALDPETSEVVVEYSLQRALHHLQEQQHIINQLLGRS